VTVVRVAHWELAVAGVAGFLGAWLVAPGVVWGLAAGVVAVAGVALAARSRWLVSVLVGALGLGGVGAALWTTHQVRRVERQWEPDSTGVRWNLVKDAGDRLRTELAEAVASVDDLAGIGIAAAGLERPAAFARLDAAARDGVEHGTVIFDGDGRPWAWSGRHREPQTPVVGLDARITAFYAVLASGRQGPGGRFAVAHVLLSADSAVPDRKGALGARFERATGVGLRFYPPGRGPFWADVYDYCVPACSGVDGVPDTLFSVRLVPPTQGDYKLALLARGSAWVALTAVVLGGALIVLGGPAARALGVAVTAALLVLTSAGRHLPPADVFSPATYFADLFGPVSTSAGALIVAAAALFIAAVARHGRGVTRWWRIGVAVAVVGVAPWALRRLATGITPPAEGTGLAVWLEWQLALTLAGAALLAAGAAFLTSTTARRAPVWVSLAAMGWALVLAIGGLLGWRPLAGWPVWYTLAWLPAFALAVVPAPGARVVGVIGVVAGSAAAVLAWGAAADGRVLLAERDVGGLQQGADPVAVGLLERFGASLQAEVAPRNSGELYARWSRSALEADRYPASLAVWDPGGVPRARIDLAALDLPDDVVSTIAVAAADGHVPRVEVMARVPGAHYVLAVPYPDGSAVTVGLGPRTRLLPPVRVARFLRGDPALPPPFTLTLTEPRDPASAPVTLTWRRDDWSARGDVGLPLPGGVRHLHAVVPLGAPGELALRGSLVLAFDVAVVLLLWLVAVWVAGRIGLPAPWREAFAPRSYRARLGLAFAALLVLPTVGFAIWTGTRLTAEARRTRDVVIRQTLADAAGSTRGFPLISPRDILRDLADRLGAELLLYDEGELRQASAPVLAELGALGWYLAPRVERALVAGDEVDVAVDQQVAGRPTRVGYRLIGRRGDDATVLGVPRLLDDPDLLRNEQDLAFGLILVTLGGLSAAAAVATVATRSLAKPVQALRAAAVQVGRGELPSPFGPGAPVEFVPVMDAFERMARDVHASRAALEAQRQRTAAVLRNVATGVVALDDRFAVVTCNPRAEEVLGRALPAGQPITEQAGVWQPVWAWVQAVATGREPSEAREFAVSERQIRVQVAPLSGATRGWVVAVDDVTDLARAVRVLAWGELARQIAHEIKNPLTPIRLGVQHLRRAYDAPRGEFADTLDRTSRQILAEIERLDAIARAFARFGAPPAGAEPLGHVDVAEVARDTAALYALGTDVTVAVEAEGRVPALARRDELKEVLINLVENARAAGATTIGIRVAGEGNGAGVAVRDDGRGIAASDLPRIFEPQFSTTTSGTGLGLAICRRLVESWGGTIAVESDVGRGTTVRLQLPGASA